jgi:hypothetical protein
MKKPKHIYWMIILSAALASCAKHPEHEGYYYVSGSADSNVEIFVNDNPTDRGYAISLFITQGENAIEYRNEFKDEGYSLRLIKTKNLFSSEFEEVLSVSFDHEQAKQNRVQKFSEPTWWKWIWEDADTLDQMTKKDYDEIFTIVDNLVQVISERNFSADFILNLPYTTWWTNDKKLKEKTVEAYRNIRSKMPPMSELVFRKAARDDIESIVGKQIVMLRAKDKNIFYLGPQETSEPTNGELKWTFSYSMESMFFARFNGQWKLLIPIE